MKNLIVFLVLFIPFSLFAQVNADNNKVKMDDQTEAWMTKISSDSEMRNQMMTMMIDKTKGNKIEMMKLANCIMDNPEMHKTMQAMQPEKNKNNNILLEPRGMSSDSVKVMKMSVTPPMPKK